MSRVLIGRPFQRAALFVSYFVYFSAFASVAWADTNASGVDENDLFGSKENAVTIASNSPKVAARKYPDLTLSGSIVSSTAWNVRRGVETNDYPWSNNAILPSIAGNFALDAKASESLRAHMGLSASYQPIGATNTNTFSVSLKEFFADFAFFDLLYFRAGKQVLSWGRGTFWTPTDLINIQKQDILSPNLVREGVNGLRLHVPIQTIFNLYSFWNLGSTLNYEQFSLSVRAEVLLGGTEIGVSYLGRKNRQAVYGLDFSSGLAGFLFYGEGMLSLEGQNTKWTTNTNMVLPAVSYSESNITYKAMLGVSRSFDEDKLSIGVEGYYSSEGYDNNPLEITNVRIALLTKGGLKSLDFGKWYAATYINYSSLFNKTTTIGVVAIANLTDMSMQLTPTLSINPVDTFSVSLRFPFYLGSLYREFTAYDQLAAVQAELSYKF